MIQHVESVDAAVKRSNLHSKYARPENEATTGQKDRTRAGKRFRFLF